MKKFNLLYILPLFFASSVFAQTRQWTLEECIRHAVENNISIKQMQLQKENAEISLNTAKMGRLPDLNAGGGQNWNFGRTQTESGLYENRSQSNASISVSSSIPLFTGFRIPNEIKRSRMELEAAVQGLEKAREDLALNVASLYLQALFNKEILKINEAQLELSRQQIERTQALVDVGKAPVSQLYDIKAQAANDFVSVTQAENNLKTALLDLAQSLELQGYENFDIVSPDIEALAPDRTDLLAPQAIYNTAIQVKPVVRQQEYAVESAESQLKIAQSAYLPILSMSLGYGTSYYYLYNSNYVNRSFSDQFKNNAGEYIGLNLSIPIFNRFQTRNQVKSARLNIDNQRLALENVKKSLYKEIETAYMNASAASDKLKAASEAVVSTSEAFKYARERYESGKSSVFEFNEAKTKLVSSQLQEVQAKYDFIFRSKILDFYNGKEIKL
jgi:outer membrane protein